MTDERECPRELKINSKALQLLIDLWEITVRRLSYYEMFFSFLKLAWRVFEAETLQIVSDLEIKSVFIRLGAAAKRRKEQNWNYKHNV